MSNLNIQQKVNAFMNSIDTISLPDSRGARLFCQVIHEEQQSYYKELENIIIGLNQNGRSIENINVSQYFIDELSSDNKISEIFEIEKNNLELKEQEYRILERYFIDKLEKKIYQSKANIIVLTRIEFTYPYVKNAFKLIMKFENITNKAILLILPADKISDNLYRYLNKLDISSPSFRIQDIEEI